MVQPDYARNPPSIQPARPAPNPLDVGRYRGARGGRFATAAVGIGRRRARLEGFHDRARPGGTLAAVDVYGNQLDARRHAERRVGHVLQRHLHEIAKDRSGVERRLGAVPQRAGLVVAHEDAERQIRSVADEPEILRLVRRSSLARQVLADFLDRNARAALDDALHDRGDLIGRQRIDHLLTLVHQLRFWLILPLGGVATLTNALVVAIDRVAPAILDAVDQGRLDSLAAVGEHRIARDLAEHRGLARAQRHRQERWQIVVDAKTLGVL